MNLPTLISRVAFGATPDVSLPTYIDVSDCALEFQSHRGRSNERSQVDPGTASVTYTNRDRRFDPTYAAGVFYPNVVPMVKMQHAAAEWGPGTALTVSGNEITDATRALLVQGDGRLADSSFGIWEGTTNLVANGGIESNTTGWAGFNGGTILRVAANERPAKFGSFCGRVHTTGVDVGVSHAVTTVASTTYTYSAWIYSATGGTYYLQLSDGIDQGLSGPFTAVPAGVWTRLTATGTTDTHTARGVYILSRNAFVEDFWIDGVQVEQKVIATPYVHTDGAAATRSVANPSMPVSVVDETQGWVAMRVRMGWPSTTPPTPGGQNSYFWSWRDDNTHLLALNYASGAWGAGRNNVTGGGPTVTRSHTAGETVTVVTAWTATQLMLSVNGSAFTVAANTTIPTLAATSAWIGTFNGGNGSMDSDMLWLAAGSGTLTDADAATLHAFGNSDPYGLSRIPGSPSMMWPADTAAALIPAEYELHTGYVENWPLEWDAPSWQKTSPSVTDSFAALEIAQLAGTFPQQTTGARITAVLAAISWPTGAGSPGTGWTLGTSALGTSTLLAASVPLTSIDAGRSTMQAVTITEDQPRGALDMILEAAAAEPGVFYIAADGTAVFKDRQRRYGAAVEAAFSDTPAGSDIQYEELTPDYDVGRVLNDVTATTTIGGVATTATASDPVSVNRYFRRSTTLTVPLISEADLQERANFELTLSAYPFVRFDRVVVKPAGQPAAWPTVLALDIGSKVTVTRTPQQGTTIVRTCFVEAVEHNVTRDDWTVSFQLSPGEPYQNVWQLGTSALGTNTTLVY